MRRSRTLRAVLGAIASVGILTCTSADGGPQIVRSTLVRSVREVQETTDPSGGSPLEGESVFVEGVVTAVSPFGRLFYIADVEGGAWCGLKVEGRSLARRPGELVHVQGIVVEPFGETRLLERRTDSRGEAPLPPPTHVNLASLQGLEAESLEGVLIECTGLTVESFTSNFGEFLLGDATANGVVVDDEFITSYIGDPGDTFEVVRGVVSYGFGSFRIEPRADEDFAGYVSGRGFPGRIEVVVQGEGGEPLPSKITLFPTNGLGLSLGPADRVEGSEDVVYLPRGKGTVACPFGSYDVVVSRGPEYGLHRQRVDVAFGVRGDVHAVLRREVESDGWIAGDFHLHCQPSFDTALPIPGRLVSLAAEGVEWAIATDHNEVTDYNPTIEKLGLRPFLLGSIGDEITTRSPNYGHFNAWPLEPAAAPLPYESVTPQELFDGARRDPGVEVVQVNHPSFGPGEDQYFDVYRLDPYTGIAAEPGFSYEFDALEVMNGKYLAQGLQNFRTWMVLRNRGYNITATGNSDSHHVVFREPGYPRNLVSTHAPSVADANEADLVDAVLAGRVVVSYGPVIDLRVNGAPVGALVAAVEGEAQLEARVQCASWMTLETAQVFVNGSSVATIPLANTKGSPLDTTLTTTYPLTRDSWVLLFVEGKGDLSPVMRTAGFRPLAFTNPVRVDFDGDGEFTPPGIYANSVPLSSIDEVDGQGVPVHLGDWVSVEGCATSGNNFPTPGFGNFFVDDGTGGVRVEEPIGTTTPLSAGERVRFAGVVGQILGETRIQGALVEVVPGKCVTEPIPTPTGSLASAEALEGRLVAVAGARVVGGSWPEGGSEGQVVIDDGSGSIPLTIPPGIVIPPEVASYESFDCLGILGQRDFTPPYEGGYQMLLRSGDDVVPGRVAPTEVPLAAAIPQKTALAGVSPNPSRGEVRFLYLRGLEDEGRTLRLDVVDVTGRVVRNLAVDPRPGAQATAWDGRDTIGRRVASGIYFLRLTGGHRPLGLRFVRLH